MNRAEKRFDDERNATQRRFIPVPKPVTKKIAIGLHGAQKVRKVQKKTFK
jgi:hypothetical protein